MSQCPTEPIPPGCAGGKGFFLSANGWTGFRSHHMEFYDSRKFTRIFVIKGGPGTGKSRMMREIAQAAEQEGATVSYIYCSSDPASLDGVVLVKGKRKIAVLDGTAPHTRCADVPGAIDEIVNLGAFWDSELLMKHREEILSLCDRKSACYQRAYRYLSIAGDIDEERQKILTSCVRWEKLKKAATRELRLLPISTQPCEETHYLSAFGMNGKVRLDASIKTSKVVIVSDPFGSARFFLNTMRDILRDEGVYRYGLFPSCFSDQITEAICLTGADTVYLTEPSDLAPARRINMKRFLLPDAIAENRRTLRLLSNERKKMLEEAELSLREVGKYHFALEKMYGDAMDFTGKEAFSSVLCGKIIRLLQKDDD